MSSCSWSSCALLAMALATSCGTATSSQRESEEVAPRHLPELVVAKLDPEALARARPKRMGFCGAPCWPHLFPPDTPQVHLATVADSSLQLAQRASVVVRVYSAMDGSPVSFALVRLIVGTDTVSADSAIGDDGTFVFDALAAGSVLLNVRAMLFQSWQQDLALRPGYRDTVLVGLGASAGCRTHVVCELEPLPLRY